MTDSELEHALYKEVLLWCADDDGYLTIQARLERARKARRYKPGWVGCVEGRYWEDVWRQTGAWRAKQQQQEKNDEEDDEEEVAVGVQIVETLKRDGFKPSQDKTRRVDPNYGGGLAIPANRRPGRDAPRHRGRRFSRSRTQEHSQGHALSFST